MPDIQQSILQDEARRQKMLSEMVALEAARSRNKLYSYFPESGPFRRDLYPKHTSFFAAGGNHIPMQSCPSGCDGSPHRERCFLAANRVGKTVAAAFEVTLHATGLYPDWWLGHRFDIPVNVWCVNDTSYNVRDVNQLELLGPWDRFGTGMLPASTIVGEPTRRTGIPKAVESIAVRHVHGGTSNIIFKSYEQGWASFTGRAIECIWADEEPPVDVYAEMCMRTMTVQGIILLTFTPLQGVTEVVKSFLDIYQNFSESK